VLIAPEQENRTPTLAKVLRKLTENGGSESRLVGTQPSRRQRVALAICATDPV